MKRRFPAHGWIGLCLVLLFWGINWFASGLRTHWAFFPLWLGYALVVDALTYRRSGTSLLTRNKRKYLALFLLSAPIWWLFEALNLRTQNWFYEGASAFSPLAYAFWTTLNFTTVIPAVFGAAELAATFPFVRNACRGPVIPPSRAVLWGFFLSGWVMLGLMLAFPDIFFPFLWISLYFILEPINAWRGKKTLFEWTKRGDWSPVLALWVGVLLTAFFWEMWNFYAYPKWIYRIPWANCCHIFEMPLLGYGGYLPFSLELSALYRFFTSKEDSYLRMPSCSGTST
jgi:hypothetical protein